MIVLLDRRDGGGGQGLTLADGEEHHLRVRRACEGDRVEVRDGKGLVGTGRLMRRDRRWIVEIEASSVTPRPPGLALAVGAGDRERFEWLVEKATELGVTAVLPVETEFSAAVASRVRPQHTGRLRRRALEALKQCGAAWVPDIPDPVPLAAVLAREWDGEQWLADPAGAAPAGSPAPVIVLIGPEGGLTATERADAVAAGYQPVRFGRNVLRFETAALAAAALAAANPRAPGGING